MIDVEDASTCFLSQLARLPKTPSFWLLDFDYAVPFALLTISHTLHDLNNSS